MPTGHLNKVQIYFYKPMPTNVNLLVVIDRYSRLPIIHIIKATKVKSIHPKFDKTLTVHGLAVEVKTDKRPPFNSNDFQTICHCYLLITTHKLPIPLRKCRSSVLYANPWQQEQQVWQQELSCFL